MIAGVELAREGSENFLRTGPSRARGRPVRARSAPSPIPGPVTRTGAVNDGEAQLGGGLRLRHRRASSDRLDLLGGLRFDHFDVDYDVARRRRRGHELDRADDDL